MLDLPDVCCKTVNEAESDFDSIETEPDIELLLYAREPFNNSGVLDVGTGCNELAMSRELANDTKDLFIVLSACIRLACFVDVSSTTNEDKAVEMCSLSLKEVLGKTPFGYDVATEETFSVCLAESEVDNCFIVVVTEIRLDANADSELCLFSDGPEVSNTLCIVRLSCRVFILLIPRGESLMIVARDG